MKSIEQKNRSRFVMIALTVISIFILFLQMLGVFDILELRWYSHHFRHRGPLTGWTAADSTYINKGTNIVLVDVDAEAWRLIPESWPYSRGVVWAKTIENLSRAGAKIIAIDIQFDTPDARSEYLKDALKGDSISLDNFIHGDILLANVIREARERGTEVILSSKIVLEPSVSPPEYISVPVPKIMNASPTTGLINDYLDEDGFARRYSVAGFMAHEQDRAYLTLGLKCVKAFADIPDSTIPEYIPKKSIWQYDEYAVQALKNSHTFLINFYGPPSKRREKSEKEWATFPSYSLASILDTRDYSLSDPHEDIDWMDQFLPGTLPAWIEMIEDPEQRAQVITSMGFDTKESPFQDKIVVIGVSVEVFHDYKSTPYYNYRGEKQFMPGMEVQANAIQTIIHNNYIKVIGGELTNIGRNGFPFYHLFVLIFVSAITILIATDRHLVRSGLELLGTSLLLIYVKYALFMSDWLWIFKAFVHELLPDDSPLLQLPLFASILPTPGKSTVLLLVAPLFAMLASYLVTVVYYYIQEQKNRRFLREMFQSYVSPELIKQMYQKKEKPELGGQEGYHTAFFSDIQSFSSFSEVLEPHQLSSVMNEYLSAMTTILLGNNGTLDKYIGDAIVAFFGAPVKIKNHEFLACATAVMMTQKASELRDTWKKDGNWPELVCNIRHRIGINSGKMVTGNMGSSMRMNYTMIGDNVNLAARLESSAKQYGVYIHISEYTFNEVKDYFEFRMLDYIRVKGKTEPVRTYEILGFKGQISDSLEECIEIFNEAHAAYERHDWEKAIELFTKSEILEEHFPYRPTTPSAVYLERCKILKENPPTEDWDGVWTLTSK